METEVNLKLPANRRCRGTDRLRENYVAGVCRHEAGEAGIIGSTHSSIRRIYDNQADAGEVAAEL